ncbi:hypothetical protein [Grylomicrobium aquisgranensis]
MTQKENDIWVSMHQDHSADSGYRTNRHHRMHSWNGLVDYAMVYTEDNIRFTFKNGQEVKA